MSTVTLRRDIGSVIDLAVLIGAAYATPPFAGRRPLYAALRRVHLRFQQGDENGRAVNARNLLLYVSGTFKPHKLAPEAERINALYCDLQQPAGRMVRERLWGN